jgi:hypothetical protein
LGQSHPAAYHHVGGLKIKETGSLDKKKKVAGNFKTTATNGTS